MFQFLNKIIYSAIVLLSIVLMDGLYASLSWSQETPKIQELGEQFDFGRIPKTVRDSSITSEQLSYFREQAANEKLYVIILSSLSVLSLVIVLLFVYKTTHTARDIVNASALIVIIFGTILLVILVDTDEQLTGGIGILGAIAGYLFGTMQRRESKGAEPASDRIS